MTFAVNLKTTVVETPLISFGKEKVQTTLNQDDDDNE
jgi:hypothetical protein